MPDFYTVVTDTGLQALGLAFTQGQSFYLTQAVVGDGNGLSVIPNKGMTTLVNEVWRGNVAGIAVDPDDPNTRIFEFAIPADTGGFTVREVGLMDENGTLFCVANFPVTEKPVAADGSVRDLVVRLPLHFENADVVNLVINPAIVLATKQDIDNHNADPQTHRLATTAQTGFVRLATVEEHKDKTAQNLASTPFGVWELIKSLLSSSITNASSMTIATPLAVKSVYDHLKTHMDANDPHDIVAKVKAFLSSSITSTSTTTFATPKAVKTVNDNLNTHKAASDPHNAQARVDSKMQGHLNVSDPHGVVAKAKALLSSSITNASSTTFATPLAVKTVYDHLTTHKNANDPHELVAKLKALLTSSVTSTSTTTFAAPKGVKIAYDRGSQALATANAKVNKINMVIFSSSGTYTKSANLLAAEVIVTGGGASGGALYYNGAGGGGAGGTSIKTYVASEISTSVSVTVGAGGIGDAANGHVGGDSKFLSQVGGGGKNSNQYHSGGAGGTASGGDLNLRGSGGDVGDHDGAGGAGGDSYWGGGGLGSMDESYTLLNGYNGSGGGRDEQTTKSGDGGNGLVVIKEYLKG